MADIKINDITNGSVNGSGVFDLLMQSVNAQLKNEFDSNRITGSAYSEVYLGSMTATLQQAITFVLGEQAADKQADLLSEQIKNAQEQNLLLQEQRNKLLAEIGLLQQKKLTEEAQISDLVNGSVVDGVIGKQKGLFQKQTDGFDRDAEQKAAKILVDTWAVRRSTDTGESANSTNKLDDTSIGGVVQDLINGLTE